MRKGVLVRNVGGEFELPARAFERGDRERFEKAFERRLELLDLTVDHPKWRISCRLKELLRLREEVCNVFYGDVWDSKRDSRNLAARLLRLAQ